MNDEFFRMAELAQQGFLCSQILLQMGLEAQGKSNQELIKALTSLPGGLGFCGKNCGALSGGACLIALYTGKGSPEEIADSRLNTMIEELVKWFEATYIPVYGGIDCSNILEGDLQNKPQRCPQIVFDTYQKVKEILATNGIDISGDTGN